MNIISLENVSKNYGFKPLFEGVTLGLDDKDKIGIIGANGSGKSTLLKVIAGLEEPDTGRVVRAKGKSLAFLAQNPQFDDSLTVLETIFASSGGVMRTILEYETACHDLAAGNDSPKLLERVAELQHELEMNGGWEIETNARTVLSQLAINDTSALMGTLSGGQRKRVALAHELIFKPDILILDEPTNHLDAESVLWLEQHLKQYAGTVIAVTHDRYFLDNVAGWILELDRGEGIPWKGNYSSWLEQKSNRLAQEEKTESKRRKTLERELEWVRMSPKGRHAKSKARIAAYDRLLNEDVKEREDKLELFIPPGPRLGSVVYEFENVTKSYGDRVLFENLSFSLPPAGVVGVIGPNGAGKTTLFKLLMGLEQPDSGTIRRGDTVQVAYVDQTHDDLVPGKTVFEIISGGTETMVVGGRQLNARAYVSKFNFSGTDQSKKLEVLSGGERNRVHLAIALKQGSNVLLLDEPTNDIDVNTLRALEEAIENFAGCAVIISHDRWFLDRVATHILAFEGDSQVYFFDGNFSEYEENKKQRLGDVQPHRIRYKSLVRS